MKADVDWAAAEAPWRTLGPEIAAYLRGIAERRVAPVPGNRTARARAWGAVEGKAFRRQREALGCSQRELGHILGYAETNANIIYQWEHGVITPPERHREKLRELGFEV